MKLLRLLSTTETESDFVAQFQEPIEIEPNSKIALHQVSFTLQPEFISVDKGNNFFYLLSNVDNFKSPGNPYGFFKLEPGNYSLLSLVQELRIKMSKGLIDPTLDSTFATSKTTMEMTAYIDDKSLMNLEYAITALKQNEDLTFKGIANDGEEPPNYYKNGTYASEWAGAYSTAPMSNGQGYIETNIYTNSGAYSLNGVCFGVLPLTPDIWSATPNMSPDIYKFCVFTQDGKYWSKQDGGVAVDTGVEVTDGDKIYMSQGRRVIDGENISGLTFWYAQSDGEGGYLEPEQLVQFEYSFELILHAALSITGDAELKSFIYSPTAFANSTELGVSLINKVDDIQKHNYIRVNGGSLGASATSSYALLFTELSQRLLGFPNIATPFVTGLTANWTGTVSMYNLAIPSALVVEMPNLPLLSYDSYTHRRRPILAVIPSQDLELNNDTITYNPSYPVFININNKYKELLNSLRIRLVATNNFPLQITPPYGCDISVLLD